MQRLENRPRTSNCVKIERQLGLPSSGGVPMVVGVFRDTVRLDDYSAPKRDQVWQTLYFQLDWALLSGKHEFSGTTLAYSTLERRP